MHQEQGKHMRPNPDNWEDDDNESDEDNSQPKDKGERPKEIKGSRLLAKGEGLPSGVLG